eukprot:14988250-Alexandrium_andersonii.AAC.1
MPSPGAAALGAAARCASLELPSPAARCCRPPDRCCEEVPTPGAAASGLPSPCHRTSAANCAPCDGRGGHGGN